MMNRIASKWNLYNTLRLFSSSSSSSLAPTNSRFSRISRSGDRSIPMIPLLNQWLQEGRHINHGELQFFIKQLRASRRFNHALQISEWMSNERKFPLLSGDIAIRLDLIAKVRGLEEAEKYFSCVPEASRDFKVYGALLNCYAQHDSVEKAEAVMQKIKEYPSQTVRFPVLNYNVMLKLYARTGQYEKLYDLMREMKGEDLCDPVTVNTLLNAFVIINDIGEMEKLLGQMEVNPLVTVDWLTYSTAADGYIKAGKFEKSLAMLKKSERLIQGKMRRVSYESLLTKYATIGKKDDVYRIWNICKNLNSSCNSSYISMLTALSRLNDIDGAERILEEWESENTCNDIRIPNVMVSAYCKFGLLKKAEAYIGRLFVRNIKFDGSTWDRLAGGYCRCKDMDKAVKMLMKAILAGRPGWKAHPFTFASCIEHVKEKRDSELASEILRICGERGYFTATTHDRLLSYTHGEIPEVNALNLIKEDYRLRGEF